MSQSFHSLSGSNENNNGVAAVNNKLINAVSKLIERGQKLGEFAMGDPYEMAMFLFAAIQGLAEMKIKLKAGFVMPSPSSSSERLLNSESKERLRKSSPIFLKAGLMKNA